MPGREARADLVVERAELVDLLHDVVSVHAPDGSYRFVSAASRELMGYAPEELLGTTPYDYFHPDDLEDVHDAHASALRAEAYTVAYRFRHKNGRYHWMETTGRVMEDDQGKVREILCSTRLTEDPAGSASNVRDLRVERIERVLRDESIAIVLQPIVNLHTTEVCAYEALSRFSGAGAPGPDVWFGDAWSVGLGVELEMLAVRKAVETLELIPEDQALSINVSPPTLGAPGFFQIFDRIEPRIRLEITEHLDITDYVPLMRHLAPFRAKGGLVAVDDFGAGYASLRHIINVKPEWVKLDIALIEHVDTDPIVLAVTSGAVSFAGHSGISLVAEGIERQSQLDTLLQAGVEFGQGYFFARPLPPDEALARHHD